MRVDHDAKSVVYIPVRLSPWLEALGGQEHVSRLPADPLKGQQSVHRQGHPATEPFDQRLTGANDRPCLLAEETGGPDDPFELPRLGGSKLCRGPVPLEEHRGHAVDHRISALGGEDGRDEQLERIPVAEREAHLGVARTQVRKNLSDPAAQLRPRFPRGRRGHLGYGHGVENSHR